MPREVLPRADNSQILIQTWQRNKKPFGKQKKVRRACPFEGKEEDPFSSCTHLAFCYQSYSPTFPHYAFSSSTHYALWKQSSLSKLSGTTILIKLSGNITTLLIYNLVMLSAPYAFSSSPFGLLETNTILRFQEPQTLSPSTNTHYTPSHSSHCWGLGEPTDGWCSSRVRCNKFRNSYSFKWNQRKRTRRSGGLD